MNLWDDAKESLKAIKDKIAKNFSDSNKDNEEKKFENPTMNEDFKEEEEMDESDENNDKNEESDF